MGLTGVTYNCYDAMTGSYICSIVNGISVQITNDQQGDIIGYYVNNTLGTEVTIHTKEQFSVTNTAVKF